MGWYFREKQSCQLHIDSFPGTRPIEAPYQAVHRPQKIKDQEVQKRLKAGIIEPTKSKWASLVLLVPKLHVSLTIFCGLSTIECRHNQGHLSPIFYGRMFGQLGDRKVCSALDAICGGYW